MLLKYFQERQKDDHIANHIPLATLWDDEKTIITKSGSLVQVINLSGIDYTSLSSGERKKFSDLRKEFFDNLARQDGQEKIHITFHTNRRKVNNSTIEKDYHSKWFNKFAKERQKQFDEIYQTETYLVVKMDIASSGVIQNTYVTSHNSIVEQARLQSFMDKFNNKVQTLCEYFAEYSPRVLDAKSRHETPLYDFFVYLLNGGVNLPVPNQEKYLDRLLALSDISFDMENRRVIFSNADKQQYAAFLSISVFPDNSTNDMLNELNRVGHQFSIIQQIYPFTKDKSLGFFNKKMKDLSVVGNFVGGRMYEIEELGNEVEAGEKAIHLHAFTVCVYGDSVKDLEEGVIKVKTALALNSVSVIREKTNMLGCFFAQLPDCESFNKGRTYPLTTENLSSFITLSGNSEGNLTCAFGNAPVTYLRTIDGGNYAFTFHPSSEKTAAGHTLVVGGTGSGKSVLVKMLEMYCRQYRGGKNEGSFKAINFDSYGGLQVPTYAFNGEYVDLAALSMSKGLQLNPMLLPDTSHNRSFLYNFISMLAQPETAEERQTIENAVRMAYEDLDKKDRILYNIRSSFGTPSAEGQNGNLAYRLDRWLPNEEDPTTTSSPYGLIFNSPTDALSFKDKELVTFEMGTLLGDDKKELLAPVAFYIEHVFAEYINQNPCPHMWFVDEMTRYISNEAYGPMILKALREWRKRNGIIVGAVQELSALTNNKRGLDMLENMQTYILYPTSSATHEDYVGKLGLTDTEFDWIKNPKHKYQVMIKRREGSSVIVDVNLSSTGKYLHLFDSGTKDKVLATRLRKSNPDNWVEEYLNIKGEE